MVVLATGLWPRARHAPSMTPVVKVVLPLHCVPARLPATSWLPAKPDGSLALAAAMYGPLNPISLLYLRSPQSCPSSPPHQLPPGKVLWHVRALVFVSASCFGSGDLILATWQLSHRRHLLTASLLSLLLLGNPIPTQLSCVPCLGAPTQLHRFYCHLLLTSQTSASLLACHHLSTPAFFLAPLALLPEWVTSNSYHP